MKKRVMSIMLAVVLGCSVCVSAPVVRAGNEGAKQDCVGGGTLVYETDVITRKDFEEGFQNYALSDATVDFAADMCAYSGSEPANVVGVVKDYDTEEMIPGAAVSVDGETVVVTGEDGRFQIKNFPSGVYDWQVSAAGYHTADYSNYDVDYADGTTIFTFYISDDFAVHKDREEVLQGDKCEQSMVSEAAEGGECAAPAAVSAMTAPPEISSWIKVYYNGKVNYVGREQYIYTVLSAEVYSASHYEAWGLTAAQRIEFYMAQAIVANTYAEYKIIVDHKHASDGYDVCSTSCCQNYDPTKVTQEAINATSYIFYSVGDVEACDMIMYKPSTATYKYAFTEFFSDCNNQGTITVPGRPYSIGVSCTDLHDAYDGHGRGMCQMGAAKLAKDGKSKSQILSYYFTDIEIVTCPLK